MECLIISKTREPLPVAVKKIQATVDFVLKKERRTGGVSVHMIGNAAMKTMNYNYRGKNKTTDVLSFAATEPISSGDQSAEWGGVKELEIDLGDIFLNPVQIKRQAKEWGVGAREEFIRMLTHGILHILGYDHIEPTEAKIMFGKQEKYLDQILNQYYATR